MSIRSCAVCPTALSLTARHHARFCSDACRKRSNRAAAAALRPCRDAGRCSGAVVFRFAHSADLCRQHDFEATNAVAAVPTFRPSAETAERPLCASCSSDISHRGPLALYCTSTCAKREQRARNRRNRSTSGGQSWNTEPTAARVALTSPEPSPLVLASKADRKSAADCAPPPTPSAMATAEPFETSPPVESFLARSEPFADLDQATAEADRLGIPHHFLREDTAEVWDSARGKYRTRSVWTLPTLDQTAEEATK